jgi:hypothetical protein
MTLRPVLALAVLCWLAAPAGAQRARPAPPAAPAFPPGDVGACQRAIAQVEPGSGIPPGLLGSVALVESGRADPAGVPRPWPWAWNAQGESHFPPDRATAIAEVSALQARGVASIDVGCMQINLRHHPQAFPELESAFDPLANVRYGARFLTQLYQTHGEWPLAIARYHSGDPVGGEDYARRVALARLSRAWAGGLPMALRLPGFCAPGMTPVLVPRSGRLATRGPPLLRCRRGGR